MEHQIIEIKKERYTMSYSTAVLKQLSQRLL